MTNLISSWNLRPAHLILGACFLALTAGHSLQAAPAPTAIEQARAQRVGQMPDEAPSHRINQVLAIKSFNKAELFALASTHPILAEHLIPGELKLATDFLFSLEGAELHRMRTGGTIIRGVKSLSKKEKKAIEAITAYVGQKEDKLRGLKIGPKDGRVYVVEVTYRIKKKKQATYQFEMVPPATPEREKAARHALTKFFGARPSRAGRGVGSSLNVRDGSFENPYSLADEWRLMQGTMLGAISPIQEVMVDKRTAVDGVQSVRFYATDRTRVFQNVVQEVPVQGGSYTRLRVQHKAENIRVEFQQRRSDFKVQLTYLSNGIPTSQPISALGRMGSHVWEMLEIESQVPINATEARIELIASLSGTAWFDGMVYEVVDAQGDL